MKIDVKNDIKNELNLKEQKVQKIIKISDQEVNKILILKLLTNTKDKEIRKLIQ